MRFMSMQEMKILAGVIEFQKKNWGNLFVKKKSPSIVLFLTAFLSYCSLIISEKCVVNLLPPISFWISLFLA